MTEFNLRLLDFDSVELALLSNWSSESGVEMASRDQLKGNKMSESSGVHFTEASVRRLVEAVVAGDPLPKS